MPPAAATSDVHQIFSQGSTLLKRHEVLSASAYVTPILRKDIQSRFGARLRGLRKDRGMTQVELAEYLGIDRSYLSDVERGKKAMSLQYLEAVADGFKITLSELMESL